MSTFLLPLIAGAAAPQIWFCPLDPIFRTEVNYGGSPQYTSLFDDSAPWSRAAAHVSVFKIYSQWLNGASDTELQVQFAYLNRHGIALALEMGVLTPSSQCGNAVEGFAGPELLSVVKRVQKNGGNLRYIAMDEPTYFATIYAGPNGCHWTVDQMAANAALDIRAVQAELPNVIFGDIEPFPDSDPTSIPQYQAGIRAFRKLLGAPLAFFHADLNWQTPNYLTGLTATQKMVASEGIPFGVIYNGSSTDASDAQWLQSAAQHMQAVEAKLGSPDEVIFQSWNAYPRKLLPETDSDSFTSLIDAYFRRRTTLSSAISGSVLQGALTATDTGQPIANASVGVSLAPTSGNGIPTLYTLSGALPPGTQSVVFGIRVNRECGCSGSADFFVSDFALETESGGKLTDDFSNQLTGWSVETTGSPAATLRIEGSRLHVTAAPDQSVQLNSSPLPFPSSSPIPLTFGVNAQVSPKSAGSGFFTLVFLGATSEISRLQIPLNTGQIVLGTTTTDASGHYSLSLPAAGSDVFEVLAAYPGSSDNWPAESTATVINQQSVSIAAITNAASYFTSAISPGEVVVLFGNGFGPATLTPGATIGGRIPASIGQTAVRFDGIPAPLLYASDTQIGAIVPYGIGSAQTLVTVTSAAGSSLPFTIPIAPAVPGLFTADSSGSGPLAALNADNTLNTPNNPAKAGDGVVIFGTGEGQTSPAGIDGLIMVTPAVPLLLAQVTLGGRPAPVEYFGSAPGEVAGVFQLNFRIPLDAAKANDVPVAVKIGSSSTFKITTLAIR